MTLVAVAPLVVLSVGLFQRFGEVRQHSDSNLSETAQTYLSGPQYISFALSEHPDLRRFDWGLSSVGKSVLAPVPAVGSKYRDDSGSFRYNFAIYGGTFSRDQIFPARAELWLATGPVGVLGVFLGLGALSARLYARTRSGSTVNRFISWYLILLIGYSFIGSIEILSQMALYTSTSLLAARFLLRSDYAETQV